MSNNVKNFIDDMTSLDEVAAEMRKIGENYITSKYPESRFLADWMYRFGNKIDDLNKINRQNNSEILKQFPSDRDIYR